MEAEMKTEDCEVKPDVFNSNPWLVQSFDEFLFYCCPECNYKCQLHEEFNSHAVTAHPLVRILLFFLGKVYEVKYPSFG